MRTAQDLFEVEHGTRVLVAGMVTHRQRPATASGVIFINLEDETGMLNVICSVGLWNRYRRVARQSAALLVRGVVERDGGAISIVADRIATRVDTCDRVAHARRGTSDEPRRRWHDRGPVSEVFEQASVSLILADFAVADQLGKLQMVGGGLQLIGRDSATGISAAFALVVSLTFPPELFNEQYAFEVVLEDEAGTPIELAEAAPVPGSRVMRFGQTLQIEEPNFRGSGVPRRALPTRSHVVLYFNTGLPLPAGRVLVWRARIDGESRPQWTVPFFVPAPPPAPVLG